MLVQVRLAGAQNGEGAAFFGVVHHDVRHDAPCLDRPSAGRVVAGSGQLQARVRAERPHGLHRALAESLAAQDGAALVILQGTRHDLAGGSRTFVDQHHQGNGFQRCGQPPQRIGASALVELGRCLVDELAFGQLAIGGNHRDVLGQERGRHRDRSVEQAARIVAQVEHHALEVWLGLVDFLDLPGEIIHRPLLELRQADPGIARLDHLAAHRLRADFFARDRHRKAAVLVLAEDGEHHLGIGFAAHALDRIVQAQALDHGVVDLGDEVIGLEARAEGRRALDRRHHLDQPVFLRDLDADADEAARGAFAEFPERLLVEILRMRVEAGDHAGDRIGDELLLVDRFHIVALDHAEHRSELLHLLEWQRGHRATRDRLQGNSRERAGKCAYGNPAGNLEFMAHINEKSSRLSILHLGNV